MQQPVRLEAGRMQSSASYFEEWIPVNLLRIGQRKNRSLVSRTYIASHYLTFICDEASERTADCMEGRYADLTGESAGKGSNGRKKLNTHFSSE